MSIRGSEGRRQRARERARQDILLAAAEVFAQRGFVSSAVAELAEAAGYAAPSLYRYFKSKEEIFRSLVELVEAEIRATFQEPVDRSAPLATRLEALLRTQFQLAEHRRPIFELLLAPPPDRAGDRSATGRDPARGLGRYEELLLEWLRRHAGRGEFRVPVELAARAIAGVAFSFHQRPPPGELEASERARAVADLALGGAAAPPRRGVHP
jgi:TetR/AcrR family transcriptional regulator, cholesterol catabolism regulator